MTLDDLELARAIHVLALVHWIGGVATVTAIVLPRARQMADAKAAVAAFEEFERRFAPQARVSISLAGLSGVYMLAKLDAWYRFQVCVVLAVAPDGRGVGFVRIYGLRAGTARNPSSFP
jgi:uncharacterized membrane protein